MVLWIEPGKIRDLERFTKKAMFIATSRLGIRWECDDIEASRSELLELIILQAKLGGIDESCGTDFSQSARYLINQHTILDGYIFEKPDHYANGAARRYLVELANLEQSFRKHPQLYEERKLEDYTRAFYANMKETIHRIGLDELGPFPMDYAQFCETYNISENNPK